MEKDKIMQCAKCVERIKLMHKYYHFAAEEDSKYTSFIFSLGFMTMTTVFTMIHKYINVNLKATIIIFLFSAIFPFIINEIYKMRLGVNIHSYISEQWCLEYQNKIDMNDLEINILRKQQAAWHNYEKIYVPIFYTSLTFGILSAITIFSVCFYLLLKN